MSGLRAEFEEMVAKADQRIEERREAGRVQAAQRVDISLIRGLLAAYPAKPAPVASQERVAEVLNDHYYDVGWSKEHQGFHCVCGWLGEDHVEHVTEALAAGVFRDEATVVTNALEDAADAIIVPGASSVAAAWLRERARLLALRAGESS
jgi:hypothetical protein